MRHGVSLFVSLLLLASLSLGLAESPDVEVRGLVRHCLECHGGEKVKGKIDFTKLLAKEKKSRMTSGLGKVRDALVGGGYAAGGDKGASS